MPIRVQCKCGQAFAAPDQYAGRTVKCPKCSGALAIPAAGAAAPAAAASPARPSPAPARAPVSSPSPYATPSAPAPDLFADAGIKAAPVGTIPCPGCAGPMPAAAVLCVKCGYHKALGRRIETAVSSGGGSSGDGHGDATAARLARAAEVLAEERAEESKTRAQGMPWWVLLIALVGLMGMGYMIPGWIGQKAPETDDTAVRVSQGSGGGGDTGGSSLAATDSGSGSSGNVRVRIPGRLIGLAISAICGVGGYGGYSYSHQKKE